MNRAEAMMLVTYTGELWPNYRLPEDAETVELRVMVWLDVLGDLDAGEVRAALVRCSGHEFAPPPGRLREVVVGERTRSVGPPDLDSAWAEFLETCRHGSYDVPVWSHPALADVARGFDVKVLAVEEESVLMNVTQAHFRRAYETCVGRWRRDNITPAPAIVALADRLSIERAS